MYIYNYERCCISKDAYPLQIKQKNAVALGLLYKYMVVIYSAR